MKKYQLRQIIREEISKVMDENELEEAFGFTEAEKIEKLKREIKKYSVAPAWKAKGITIPSEEEIKAMVDKAKADKFEGKIGADLVGKKIIYKASKDIKWKGQFDSGGSGGRTAGGGA